MTRIKRYKNIVEKFLSGESGQRFFNFAYSIGAAIVIWGALFKILHLPGGNTLLSIGMGTEVLMFILTAFDRPNRDYHWEEVFPALRHDGDKPKSADDDDDDEEEDESDVSSTLSAAMGHGTGGSVNIIGGAGATGATTIVAAGTASGTASTATAVAAPATVEGTTTQYISSMETIAEQMRQLSETTSALNRVSQTLLDSYNAVSQNSDQLSLDSKGYVEQMRALNRNIAGLNTIYEIQLKSISSQLEAIESVNDGIREMRAMYERSAEQSARYCEEADKMAYYMEQINKVYDNMLRAMTMRQGFGAPYGAPSQHQADNN